MCEFHHEEHEVHEEYKLRVLRGGDAILKNNTNTPPYLI